MGGQIPCTHGALKSTGQPIADCQDQQILICFLHHFKKITYCRLRGCGDSALMNLLQKLCTANLRIVTIAMSVDGNTDWYNGKAIIFLFTNNN